MAEVTRYEVAGLSLIYRVMVRPELQAACQILVNEGWMPLLSDLLLAFDAYPDTYRGLYLADSGQLVGKYEFLNKEIF